MANTRSTRIVQEQGPHLLYIGHDPLLDTSRIGDELSSLLRNSIRTVVVVNRSEARDFSILEYEVTRADLVIGEDRTQECIGSEAVRLAHAKRKPALQVAEYSDLTKILIYNFVKG